jgi:hypothetical protein
VVPVPVSTVDPVSVVGALAVVPTTVPTGSCVAGHANSCGAGAMRPRSVGHLGAGMCSWYPPAVVPSELAERPEMVGRTVVAPLKHLGA